MEETRELEQAIAEVEARTAQVQATRVQPLKDELAELERQLATHESMKDRLNGALRELPTSATSASWLFLVPMCGMLGVIFGTPYAFGATSFALIAAFLAGNALGGRR